MKAKVIIEDGRETIILTPETDFEQDIIERVYIRGSDYTIQVAVRADNSFGFGIYTGHRIELSIDRLDRRVPDKDLIDRR